LIEHPSTALEFDEERHIYRLQGRVIPSVTSTLKAVYPELWNWSDGFAMERGRVVHRCIELMLEHDLDESSVAERAKPYVEAAKRFIVEMNVDVHAHERRIYSATYDFAGTLDLVAIIDGRTCLLDWKTGDPGWPCGPQTAAYGLAWHEMTGQTISRRYGVQLKADGSYILHSYTDRTDKDEFLAALRVYRRRKVLAAA
jgi:hypothetical protein